jgi:predicted RNA-binding Zn-ribbon protein involved in translation (DUF1610 family)
MAGKIRIDPFRKTVSYPCNCGRRIVVRMEDVVPESKDYCGCGRVTIRLGTPEDIAQYRQLAGLPKLDE